LPQKLFSLLSLFFFLPQRKSSCADETVSPLLCIVEMAGHGSAVPLQLIEGDFMGKHVSDCRTCTAGVMD
jgi:hypothetical protein